MAISCRQHSITEALNADAIQLNELSGRVVTVLHTLGEGFVEKVCLKVTGLLLNFGKSRLDTKRVANGL